MAWDSTRPVPWKRLMIEWLVIGAVVALVSWFITDNRKPENYISIVLAGGVYVGFGALLAKLGYARKSLKQLRAETAEQQAARAAAAGRPAAQRPKPAPTRRTSTGPSNRPNRKKR
jgi:hypothetical protein